MLEISKCAEPGCGRWIKCDHKKHLVCEPKSHLYKTPGAAYSVLGRARKYAKRRAEGRGYERPQLHKGETGEGWIAEVDVDVLPSALTPAEEAAARIDGYSAVARMRKVAK